MAPWGRLGGPWEPHEGHVGVKHRIFGDFGTIWDDLGSLRGERFENWGLISIFFCGPLFVPISAPIFRRLGLLRHGFRMNEIEETALRGRSFLNEDRWSGGFLNDFRI